MPKAEDVASQFMASGRPAPSGDSGGSVLGGLQIKTPQVGDGFVEWAVAGYSLEGVNAPTDGLNYDKSGDWAYDRQTVEQGKHRRYIPELKSNQK